MSENAAKLSMLRKEIEGCCEKEAAEIVEAAQKLNIKDEGIRIRLIGGIAKQPEIIPWIKTYAHRFEPLQPDIAFADVDPVRGAVQLAKEEM